LLNSLHPDLIVTDLMMPGLNGIELIRAIRELPQIAKIPIIVLTAFSEGFREQALAAGAAVVLEKPDGTLGLADEVRRVLGN